MIIRWSTDSIHAAELISRALCGPPAWMNSRSSIVASDVRPKAELVEKLLRSFVSEDGQGVDRATGDTLEADGGEHELEFEKHGIANVGYWLNSIGGRSDELWYIVGFESLAQREQAWASDRVHATRHRPAARWRRSTSRSATERGLEDEAAMAEADHGTGLQPNLGARPATIPGSRLAMPDERAVRRGQIDEDRIPTLQPDLGMSGRHGREIAGHRYRPLRSAWPAGPSPRGRGRSTPRAGRPGSHPRRRTQWCSRRSPVRFRPAGHPRVGGLLGGAPDSGVRWVRRTTISGRAEGERR